MRGVIIIFLFPVAAWSASIELAYQFYKDGKYEKSLEITKNVLHADTTSLKSEKALFIYIASETSLYLIDRELDARSGSKKGYFYYLAVYHAMERALVMGNYPFGLKWGKEMQNSPEKFRFSSEGLYIYACILMKSGEKYMAKKLIKESLAKTKNLAVREKFKSLLREV